MSELNQPTGAISIIDAQPVMATRGSRHLIREDLAAIYGKLQPSTIGCFDVEDFSCIPLETFVGGQTESLFIDGHGDVTSLLAREVAGLEARRACLACDERRRGTDVCAAYVPGTSTLGPCCGNRLALPRAPGRCVHFMPGRRMRIVHGDPMRGRASVFATRVEGVIATAESASAAIEEGIALCRRSQQIDIPLPIEDGSLDLVISVLAPTGLMLMQPYLYFEQLMCRRFAEWATSMPASDAERLGELRRSLVRTQLDAHVRELARLAHPERGRLYFAARPAEQLDSGVWSLGRGVGESLQVLSRYFHFDFDTLPAEAFLRRAANDLVLHASVLRPIQQGTVTP